ncbi:MAG: gliding motility-associated C-terminal domain-containing protein [Saprospiraceae bacterium]
MHQIIVPMNLNSTLLLCFFFISTFVLAQRPTVQDCLGAIPVCQQVYEEADSPTGIGNFNEINPDLSCSSQEDNTIWYTFQVDRAGDFGFLITPNNLNDDYDWWLFDVTGGRCVDIGSDGSLTVSCNVTGGGDCDGRTGATGESNLDQQGSNCNAWFPSPNQFGGSTPFNDLISVQAGNTYALCISNWSGSPNGYKIDFGYSGDIGILDEKAPEIADVITPETCDESAIIVSFTENIQCATVAAANFSLTGPGGPYEVSLNSASCDAGGEYDQNFELEINPPIASLGDFSLTMTTDNSTEVLDLCDNPAETIAKDFSVTEPTSSLNIDLGGIHFQICDEETLLFDATFPDADATYQWQDGSTESTLTARAAGTYSVTVTTNCSSGEASVIVDQADALPTLDLGENKIMCDAEDVVLDATVIVDEVNYLWSDGSTNPTLTISQSGTYSVTISNDCDSKIDAIDVFYNDDFTIDLGEDRSVCNGETVTLSTNVTDAEIAWSNGSNAAQIDISESGEYSVTVTTTCATKSDAVNVIFTDTPQIELGRDTTLCNGESIELNAFYEGGKYAWQDGSTEADFVAETAGTYEVTVSNGCGSTTVSKRISFYEPIEINLGRDTSLCAGERHILDASSKAAETYIWEDGSNEEVNYIEGPGFYSVRVSNVCEEVVASIDIPECTQCVQYVPNAFSPNGDGHNDVFQTFSNCAMEAYQLRVYDRWGNQVYLGNDPQLGWDGVWKSKAMSTGIYLWYVEYTVDEDGDERVVTEAGEILLTR